MVAPAGHGLYRFLENDPDPEHGLETSEGHSKWANLSVLPVADTSELTRVRVHVDVVLQEVNVVGYHWPVGGKYLWELRDEPV